MAATTGMSAKPEVPPTHQKVPRRWPRRLYIAITSVLALTALIYFIMPSIARYVAIQMLEKQGMSQVQIKEIHWKPWIPSLTLNSASWQTPASEPVSLASAEITLDWKTLAHKHISITDLDVQALKLPIQIKPYIVIAGFPIQQQSSQEDQEQAPSASNTNPWHISLSKFKVTDTLCQ